MGNCKSDKIGKMSSTIQGPARPLLVTYHIAFRYRAFSLHSYSD